MAYLTPQKTPSPPDQMFPVLTPAQQARVAAHGRGRQVQFGETLVELDDNGMKLFLVVTGHLNIIRTSGETEEVVPVYSPGTFIGQLTKSAGPRRLGLI